MNLSEPGLIPHNPQEKLNPCQYYAPKNPYTEIVAPFKIPYGTEGILRSCAVLKVHSPSSLFCFLMARHPHPTPLTPYALKIPHHPV